MKKTLIIAAAALVSASAFSQTVSSANVVGYIQSTTPAAGSYDIVSLGILGTNDTVDIQQAVANQGVLNSGGSILGNAAGALAAVDKLLVWTGSGYNTYGLYAGASNFWMISTSLGWSKSASALPSSATITRGQGVWFQTGTGGISTNLMTAGEVPNDGTYDVNLNAGFSLIAYPYSATINLTNLVVNNATASGSILGNAAGAIALADKIYVWSGSGYNTYGLYAGASNFWMVSTSLGWSKSASAAPSAANIDLGKGIWYESVDGAKTIGFTQNYTID